jgi:hypothetical protein
VSSGERSYSEERKLIEGIGWKPVAALISFILGSWLAAPHVLPRLGVAKGEIFDALAALFSGLALAGVVVAIILQSQELRAQREEMKAQREEMRGQRAEMEAARAEAQRTASAQEVVAAIAAVSALIPHYEALADMIHKGGGGHPAPSPPPKQRLAELAVDLEVLYQKVRETATRV